MSAVSYKRYKNGVNASLEIAVRMECARTFPPVSLAPNADGADLAAANKNARPGPAAAAFFKTFLG